MALMSTKIGYSTGIVNGYLTGNAAVISRSFYRPMLEDVVNRIEERLKALGISATKASKQAGLSEDAIRNMKRALESNDRKGVSTRTISALAPVLQTTTSWLLDGIDADGKVSLVRIIGRVGANADDEIVMTSAQEAFDYTLPPPGGTTESVALEVHGHSMRGFADDGALIYFEIQRTPPTPDMLSHVAIVETEDGRVLLKRLLRGSGPGLYDLESTNGPTIRDVRLRWAAEPTAIVPPKHAQKIIRRHGEEAA